MSKSLKAMTGFMSFIICYGGYATLAFLLASFVQGNLYPLTWSVGARLSLVVMGGLGAIFAAMIFEIDGVRSNIRDAILELAEEARND